MEKAGVPRLFQSLKLVKHRKGKIGALFLLGIFASMLIGSMNVPASVNEVDLSFIQPIKSFQVSDVDEYRFVDAYGDVDWDEVGSDPYMDIQDETSWIEQSSNGVYTGWCSFADTSGTGSDFTVVFSVYHDSTNDAYIQWELDWTSDGTAEASGTFSTAHSYAWEEDAVDLSALDTQAEIDQCRVRFQVNKGSGGPNLLKIDAARLYITQTGGTAYEKNLTESVTVGDVQTRTITYDRSYTESISVVDVQTNAADMARNFVESISVVGVLAILRGREKDLVEAITASDVRTFSIDYARNLAETISVSGIWSKEFGLNRTEAISVVDAGTFSKFIQKNMTEAIGVSDSMVRSAGYSREMTENITTVDLRTLSIDYTRNWIENINVVDIIDTQKTGGTDYEKNLTESINISPVLISPTEEINGSMFYQLFYSTNMWGYLGPFALVIGGFIVANKDTNLGILWFVVECLVVAQYLLLVAETPAYWWHIYILLLGGLITCVYSLVDR